MLPFILACDGSADPEIVDFDPLADATSAGEYGIGHGETEVEYVDPLGAMRTLRTSSWWPTKDTSGEPARYFLGSDESEVAFENASIAEGTFPVAVFSHGHQAYAECSSFLMEHLASHGFVVIAPDHTNNTTLDGADRDTDIYLQRPADLSAVMDALEAGELPVPRDQTTGEYVVLGHSFGGYTVFATAGATYDVAGISDNCATEGDGICTSWSEEWAARFADGGQDERFAAALAMAPGDYALFGDAGAASVDVPVLLMTGEVDPEHSADGADYWSALEPLGNRYVSLANAGHNAFTDFSGVFEDGGTIDADAGFRIVDAYALAFLAGATGDDRYSGILDGSIEVDALATLH